MPCLASTFHRDHADNMPLFFIPRVKQSTAQCKFIPREMRLSLQRICDWKNVSWHIRSLPSPLIIYKGDTKQPAWWLQAIKGTQRSRNPKSGCVFPFLLSGAFTALPVTDRWHRMLVGPQSFILICSRRKTSPVGAFCRGRHHSSGARSLPTWLG